MRLRPRHAPVAVFACGVAFTLYLQGLVPDGAFPNSDAGLKAMQAAQFARGDFAVDLRLPAEPWTVDLWREGLFPIDEPYVYRRADGWYSLYPVYFPLVSAPGYALLGSRGLYVVPLVATWALWLSFLHACRGLRLPGGASAAGLALLAFASPVTVYSAMFWEHTLAVALAFHGLALVFLRRPGDRPSPPVAAAAGVCVGLAAWFREEHLLLVALLLALCMVPAPERWGAAGLRGCRRAVAAALAASVGAWLAANQAAYGHALGLHTVGARASQSWTDWTAALVGLRAQGIGLLLHFPAALLALAVTAVAVWRRAALRLLPVLGLGVAFVLLVPLASRTEGGRQWGPRFLFVTVPIGALAAAAAPRLARRGPRAVRAAAWTAVAATATAGAWVNSAPANPASGVRVLERNYRRRAVPLDWLRSRPERFVAVSHAFVAGQLADLVGHKTLFRVSRGRDLRRLAEELAKRGEGSFLYVCYPHYPCAALDGEPRERALPSPEAPEVVLRQVARLDRYLAYQVRRVR